MVPSQVVVAAISKRKLVAPSDPIMLHGGNHASNDVVPSSTLPHTPRLRSCIELIISLFLSQIFNFLVVLVLYISILIRPNQTTTSIERFWSVRVYICV